MCELVREIEEAFGISIPDDQAGNIVTVGDLYTAIVNAAVSKKRNSNICLSARTFYELRRCLQLNGARSNTAIRIAPSTLLTNVLPSRQRRKTWVLIEDDLNLRFPRLRRPFFIVLIGWHLSAAIALSGFAYIKGSLALGTSAMVAFLAFLLTMSLFLVLTVPFATLPGRSFLTLRGLTEQLLARNWAKLADRHNAFSTRDIWTILSLILMDQLGVDRERITPDAHLVRDLGYE